MSLQVFFSRFNTLTPNNVPFIFFGCFLIERIDKNTKMVIHKKVTAFLTAIPEIVSSFICRFSLLLILRVRSLQEESGCLMTYLNFT